MAAPDDHDRQETLAIRDEQEKVVFHYEGLFAAGEVTRWGLNEARTNDRLLGLAYDEFKDARRAVLPEQGHADSDHHFEHGMAVRNAFAKVRAAIRTQIDVLSPVVSQPNPFPAVVNVEHKREPHIGVFDGSPHEWMNFRDLFKSEVGNRDDIPNATKLRYLQEACVHKASEIIGPWARTDANFEPAWKFLTDRFDDEFPLQQSLIKRTL